ncbi:cytochrome-c oxidase, cbb3-type subunit III [Phaeospirillum tilakii]|uniref:Cbb3-type cytochrome c oxidase subunit n=1 Tax=Phaeospirillum tilakii TaxID=741673 RepID=A0ABW5CE89_9PROT
MGTVEKDPVTGRHTTGHEWDGIRELNTPLPRWWVVVFWACVLWAIGYWVLMPTWPLRDDFTHGLLGYSSRGVLEQELALQRAERAAWRDRLVSLPIEAVEADPELLTYARAGGRIAFEENCAPCHGVGGVGAPGYPTLADDEWLWGGTLPEIEQTIKFGVRNSNPDSHQSEMPKFGADGILTPDQIEQVADYVLTLANRSPNPALPGAAIFAENCAVCHGEQGEGTPAVGAPPLNNQIWLYASKLTNQTPEVRAAEIRALVVRQVTRPSHGSMPAWSERLDPGTIRMLAVYVHTLGGGR